MSNSFYYCSTSRAFRDVHCVKSVRIQSFPDPHFPAFGMNTAIRMRENA